MRSGIRKAPVAIAVIAAVVLAGCAGADGGNSAGPSGERTADPQASISVAQIGAPTSLDPHLIRNPPTDLGYIFPLYDPLLYLDSDLEVTPGLAESWEVADDGLSMSLGLRDDVTFQDGSGFDAEVVKANLERAKDLPGSTAASFMSRVESVEIAGPQAVRINFSDPTYDFPITIASQPGVGSMISGEAIESAADISRNPAGSGPFSLVELGQDRLRLERYERYWDPENAAQVKTAEIIGLGDDTARVAALQSGQADLAIFAGHLASSYTPLLNSGRFSRSEYEPGMNYGAYVNLDSSPQLQDARVRKAISLAIDRESMNQAQFDGAGEPLYQFYPEGGIGHVADVDTKDQYNPGLARKLLAEAGASDLDFEIIVTGTEPHTSLATIAQAQLAEVGVDVTLTRINGVDARSSFKGGAGNAYANALLGMGDPSVWVRENLLAADRAGGQPEAVVEAAEDALDMHLNDPDRAAAFENLTRVTNTEPVDLFFVRVPVGYVWADRVIGADRMNYGPWGTMVDLRSLAVADSAG
jgi:peptide/nickel transport system substrate-binding protein